MASWKENVYLKVNLSEKYFATLSRVNYLNRILFHFNSFVKNLDENIEKVIVKLSAKAN